MICTVYSADLNPKIVVYGGTNQEFAEMLASVINNDTRIEAETLVASTPKGVSLATALPNLRCIVIFSDNAKDLSGFKSSLIPFFEEGGGLVGIKEICYIPSAEELAKSVFPIYGNATEKELSPRKTRTRTYVVEEETEITENLPDNFEILSMGTYYSANEEGEYVEIGGSKTVVYRDGEVGCPLVVTNQSEKGGRSVSLPGIMVVSVPRVDVYYGNIVQDEEFVTLFTNSVLWASGNARSQYMESDLSQRIEDADNRYEELKKAASESEKERNQSRLTMLLLVWALGIAFCGVVAWKIILPSPGE